MKTLLLTLAAICVASPSTAAASQKDINKCWQTIADAQDFIAAAPGYYSVESVLALERCMKKISADTTLGKRLRKLHGWLEAQPLGGE